MYLLTSEWGPSTILNHPLRDPTDGPATFCALHCCPLSVHF